MKRYQRLAGALCLAFFLRQNSTAQPTGAIRLEAAIPSHPTADISHFLSNEGRSIHAGIASLHPALSQLPAPALSDVFDSIANLPTSAAEINRTLERRLRSTGLGLDERIALTQIVSAMAARGVSPAEINRFLAQSMLENGFRGGSALTQAAAPNFDGRPQELDGRVSSFFAPLSRAWERLTGKSTDRAWRRAPEFGVVPPEPESSLLPGKNGSEVVVVEFDDLGALRLASQSEFLIQRLTAHAEDDARPLRVVFFIHGWQNDARPGNSNLEQFRGVIGSLAGSDEMKNSRVVGIFIGWRGISWDLPVLTFTTFWNRAAAALRIANAIALPNLIDEISRVLRQNPQHTLTLVAHSFGARQLQQAVTHRMPVIGERWFADLVILLNPATEGFHAYEWIKAFRRDHDGEANPQSAPLIVSLTSVGDWATRICFPLGRWLDRTLRLRDYKPEEPDYKFFSSQRPLYRRIAAALPFLPSHRVAELSIGTPETNTEVLRIMPRPSLRGMVLRSLSDAAFNTTPFWVLSLPEWISKNHSDIANPQIVALVSALVTQFHDSAVPDDPEPKKPQ